MSSGVRPSSSHVARLAPLSTSTARVVAPVFLSGARCAAVRRTAPAGRREIELVKDPRPPVVASNGPDRGLADEVLAALIDHRIDEKTHLGLDRLKTKAQVAETIAPLWPSLPATAHRPKRTPPSAVSNPRSSADDPAPCSTAAPGRALIHALRAPAGGPAFMMLDGRGEWAWRRYQAGRRPGPSATSRPSTSRRASSRFGAVGRSPDGSAAMSPIAARTRHAIDPQEDSYATRRRRPDRPEAPRPAGTPPGPRRPIPGAVHHGPTRQRPARPGRFPLRHHAPDRPP